MPFSTPISRRRALGLAGLAGLSGVAATTALGQATASAAPASPTFTAVPTPTRLSGPTDFVPGPDGGIWFSELAAGKLGRIDTTTLAITEYALPTPFSAPGGPAATADAIWVPEAAGNKVARLDLATKKVTELPVPSVGASPIDISIGSDGGVWCVEPTANKLLRIDPATFDMEEVSFPRPLATPIDTKPHSDGRIWGGEFTGNALYAFDPVGRTFEEFPVAPLTNPGAVVDPSMTPGVQGDGLVWFTATMPGTIGSLDPRTGKVQTYPIPTPLSAPMGMTVGGDGALWFCEAGGQKLGRFDRTTHKFTEYQIGGLLGSLVSTLTLPVVGGVSVPLDLTWGPDKTLWVGDFAGGAIVRLQLP
jgi:streptogramin lyase